MKSRSFIHRCSLGLYALYGLSALAAEPTPVKLTTSKRADIHRWVTLPGTLKANQQATLYAKVAGYLTKVAVDKGDTVKADQPLGELEVPELLADLKKFEADVKVAEIELGRLTDAQKKAPDLVLPQMLDKARGSADVARATMERTKTFSPTSIRPSGRRFCTSTARFSSSPERAPGRRESSRIASPT